MDKLPAVGALKSHTYISKYLANTGSVINMCCLGIAVWRIPGPCMFVGECSASLPTWVYLRIKPCPLLVSRVNVDIAGVQRNVSTFLPVTEPWLLPVTLLVDKTYMYIYVFSNGPIYMKNKL